ncbi:hypothetical protein JYB87_07125 [Shewanella avicenniae]|uniref:Nickel transport protein n=1 Tax=Shewanella avicenniae TaxID=2814294 RepID=A0ABX7QU11_9GAMM|nr:hypothetical protein [Shewanella avicenniae]QSX34983.1 hypothetical protein JYB87_07125 [Shewanella avicenniae]
MLRSCKPMWHIIGLALLLECGSASAHLLKVFAWMEGEQVAGKAYFAGGVSASGAFIVIYDANQQQLAKVAPDAAGNFRVDVPYSAGYRVEANTGDGHVATWEIPAAEVTAPATAATSSNSTKPKKILSANGVVTELPAVASQVSNSQLYASNAAAPKLTQTVKPTAEAQATSVSASISTDVTPVVVSQQALQQLIETAVAKEVGPLRMELQQTASRAKLSDIIGGLGFIFGIAGFAMWWRSKKS